VPAPVEAGQAEAGVVEEHEERESGE